MRGPGGGPRGGMRGPMGRGDYGKSSAEDVRNHTNSPQLAQLSLELLATRFVSSSKWPYHKWANVTLMMKLNFVISQSVK